jgi:hypothetical protein
LVIGELVLGHSADAARLVSLIASNSLSFDQVKSDGKFADCMDSADFSADI